MRLCDNDGCDNVITPGGAWIWVTDSYPFRLYCSQDCFDKCEKSVHDPIKDRK